MAVFKDLEDKQGLFDLIDKFEKSSLSELELSVNPGIQVKDSSIKIKLKKNIKNPGIITAKPEETEISDIGFDVPVKLNNPGNIEKGVKIIKAPLVGTFYLSPSPDAEAYVKPGDIINKGDIVCIIEAMKTMNEIESEFDGEVLEVAARNGVPVEYGQPLFKLR
ncbi:MAG: acetyl-CoA carboxylase biotin carboxyl carrier protein [Oscillospiraceae bacterium]|nr:acetyl-CoA carboxylase biotin carboxyl carrier protein [Oscillospiraceae bacterium]